MINGEEYPPYLYDGDRKRSTTSRVVRAEQITPEQRRQLFAFGSDTGNLQIGFVMMGVLFLREHNRIARSLQAAYPGWDDERLFQTARNILTVILIRIVVEEYINHISPYHLQAARRPDRLPQPALVPAELDGDRVQPALPLAQPRALELPDRRQRRRHHGHAVQHRQRRRARAGRLLRGRIEPAGGPRRPLQLAPRGLGGRARERAPGARGRRCARTTTTGRSRASRARRRVEDISHDRRVQQGLRDVYGSIDEIEFYPGLFAEDVRPNAVLPPLIGRMVAIDAFSQAFTNPLLSPRVFNPQTFSPLGWDLIRDDGTLSDLLHRNVPDTRPPLRGDDDTPRLGPSLGRPARHYGGGSPAHSRFSRNVFPRFAALMLASCHRGPRSSRFAGLARLAILSDRAGLRAKAEQGSPPAYVQHDADSSSVGEMVSHLWPQGERAYPREAPADDAEIERGDAQSRERRPAQRAPAWQGRRHHERPAEREHEMDRHRGSKQDGWALLPGKHQRACCERALGQRAPGRERPNARWHAADDRRDGAGDERIRDRARRGAGHALLVLGHVSKNYRSRLRDRCRASRIAALADGCGQLWCRPAHAIRAKTSAVPHATTTAAICPGLPCDRVWREVHKGPSRAPEKICRKTILLPAVAMRPRWPAASAPEARSPNRCVGSGRWTCGSRSRLCAKAALTRGRDSELVSGERAAVPLRWRDRLLTCRLPAPVAADGLRRVESARVTA